ncbi:MAG: RNase adapter RapZ [Gemmatimonadales bacterium]|jgi:aminoglycoside/choline kinase family phosphotransferase
MKERLIGLFGERFGRRPDVILDMAADGSQRQYFRLVWDGDRTVVGAIGPDHDENRAFLAFARAFRGIGLPVPEVYAEDQDAGVWLEEDLGDTTLFAALSAARAGRPEDEFPADIEPLYRRVLEILPRFQVEGHRAIDYRLAYPRRAFDEQSIRWDLNYFKYHFLKLAQVPFNEQRLEDDFARLTAHLLQAGADTFLYRDFQSRNIMIRGGEPWFVDFQGGRNGAPHYDVASLLYDAKANVPPPVRAALLEHYLDALGGFVPVDRARFREQFTSFVLARLMQAMGAYGYRGFFERKRRFLESVPNAARNLDRLLAAGLPVALPELERVFRRIADRWAGPAPSAAPQSGLVVLIQSFSFRDGYPPDTEGHGGGFVFDCRALPNPHHEPDLRDLTGEAPAVADFLERSPEVQAFWGNVSDVVDAQVERFVARGFSSLTVSFGCTGGRHRSVFMAAKLAAHLAARHPHVGVRIRHAKL